MPLDHYVTLGRSGLRVSPFALGAMTLGEDPPGAGCSPEESEKILETYLDLGGNFIDTANFYTNGHSEKILGDFFAAHRGRREHVVLRRSSSATCSRATPTAAARAAARSSRSSTRRCAACGPTTWTCTGCITGTATLRSRKPCGPSTTWSERARCATSASPVARCLHPRRAVPARRAVRPRGRRELGGDHARAGVAGGDAGARASFVAARGGAGERG